MQAILKQLEAALKKSYPRRLATFGKPVKNLGKLGKVPDEVAALYAWHGAAPGLLVTKDTEESYDGWDLSSPDAALADAKIWKKVAGVTWLPLFTNHGGDNICVDDKGRLVGLFHEEPDRRPVMFPSLEKAMAYVLSRVKAGKWCGVPEVGELKRVLGKIDKKPTYWGDLFGNDIFRVMDRDPLAGLVAIAAAEKAGAPMADVLKYRAEAQLAAKQLDAAWETFRAYLRDALARGSTYNPPWRDMRDGFAKAKQPQRAFVAGEILEMDGAYLFDAWLTRKHKARMKDFIATADATIGGTDPEDEVRGWIKFGMSEADARAKVAKLVASGSLAAAKGPELARAYAAKAQALGVLGKPANKEWAAASKADAKVAAFWRSFLDELA